MLLKESKTKMNYQEHKRDRMDNWSNLVAFENHIQNLKNHFRNMKPNTCDVLCLVQLYRSIFRAKTCQKSTMQK